MSKHVNYRKFRVTFEYQENAGCIHMNDHGIATLREFFATELFPQSEVLLVPDTLEITEVQ